MRRYVSPSLATCRQSKVAVSISALTSPAAFPSFFSASRELSLLIPDLDRRSPLALAAVVVAALTLEVTLTPGLFVETGASRWTSDPREKRKTR